MSRNKLLVVDDEAAIGDLISDVAEELGFQVRIATDRASFREALEVFGPTAVTLDLQMPDMDGIEAMNCLKERKSKLPIVVMSGFDRRVLKTAVDYGRSASLDIRHSLEKPVDVAVLEEALSDLLMAPDSAVTPEALDEALEKRQFFARFQPKLSVAPDGASVIRGVEALARWRHPARGEVSPGEFIPLAEETGQIRTLTFHIFDDVLRQIGDWRRQDLNLSVAFNLSPRMLGDARLPDELTRRATDAGVSPSSLTIEVTESAAMAEAARTTEILTRFRLKGFALSIDDFGTGYSSLVELYRMPFSELKIDRAFVSRMLIDDEASVIVRSLAQLARGLGLSVCAEGAEDAETIDALISLDVDFIQGFGISKPLLGAEVADFLFEWSGPRRKPPS